MRLFRHLCSEWCLAQLAARYGVTQFSRAPFDCKLPGPSKGTLAALVQDILACQGTGVTAVIERPFRCISTAPHATARPQEWIRSINEALNNIVHLEEMVRGVGLCPGAWVLSTAPSHVQWDKAVSAEVTAFYATLPPLASKSVASDAGRELPAGPSASKSTDPRASPSGNGVLTSVSGKALPHCRILLPPQHSPL